MNSLTGAQVLMSKSNVELKILNKGALEKKLKLHNTITDDGIYSTLYALISARYDAQIKGIRFVCSDATATTKFLITDSNAPTEKILNTGRNAAAEFKFFLDTSQLVGQTITEIQLLNNDSTGAESIYSRLVLPTPIIKTQDTAILILWQITLQNATV